MLTMRIYKPREFGALINRSVKTLQRWDYEGRLKAHRTPQNRRYYTHDQYLEYKVSQIVIAHKDRLVRFGFEWFERFCENHGTKVIVMNNESLSPEEEMTRDMLSIAHCFSSRLYGLRKYKKNIAAMITEKPGENGQTS